MRVAGDQVDVLAGGLRVVEPGVDQLAGALPRSQSSMACSEPVEWGSASCMPATMVRMPEFGARSRSSTARSQCSCASENSSWLALSRVMKSTPFADPVIPGPSGAAVCAVGLALGGNLGTIEERGELLDVALAGHGLDGLMIAAAEEDGERAERSHLVGQEVVPRALLVVLVARGICRRAPSRCRSWSGCDIQRKSPRCQ